MTSITFSFIASLILIFGESKAVIVADDGDSPTSGNSPSDLTVRGEPNFPKQHHLSLNKKTFGSLLLTRLLVREEDELRLAALVDFLVSTSTGRQLYLLHDIPDTEVTQVMVTCYRRWGDVATFRYMSQMTEVAAALTSNSHSQTIRNVLIICSRKHTIHIFKQVRERSLESASINWYVVMHEDYTGDLLNTLREGTQISAAVRVKEGWYDLYLSHVDHFNKMRLQRVGWWSWNTTKGSVTYLSQPLYRDLSLAYSDFGGRELKVSVTDYWPFFKVITNPDGSVQPHSGIDLSILTVLAQKLNFTYRLVSPADSNWGDVLENGTVTGMIGMVARHEAHLAIDDITITGRRESVVDFTMPYLLDFTTLISSAPKEKSRTFAVFSPFTIQVWLTLVMVTLVMGPVLSVVSWLGRKYDHEEPQHSLSTFSFNVFRSLVIQGNQVLARPWEMRLLFFSWYCFCLIIYALYAGTLTAVLAIPAQELPIDSLWDLLDAMKYRGYMPLLHYGGSTSFLFMNAESGIYKEIWDEFDPEKGFGTHSSQSIIDKVLIGKYVLVGGLISKKVYAIQRGQHKYHFAKHPFYPQPTSIACPSGSPYTTVFSLKLVKMMSAGLVDKWIDNEMQKVRTWQKVTERGPRPFTLLHLQAVFYILLLGFLLATVALLMETLFYKTSMFVILMKKYYTPSA